MRGIVTIIPAWRQEKGAMGMGCSQISRVQRDVADNASGILAGFDRSTLWDEATHPFARVVRITIIAPQEDIDFAKH